MTSNRRTYFLASTTKIFLFALFLNQAFGKLAEESPFLESKPVSSSEKSNTSEESEPVEEKDKPIKEISPSPKIETLSIKMGAGPEPINIFKTWPNKDAFDSMIKRDLVRRILNDHTVGGQTCFSYPYRKVKKDGVNYHQILNILMDQNAYDAYVKYYSFDFNEKEKEVYYCVDSTPPPHYESKDDDPKSLVDENGKPKKEYHFSFKTNQSKNLRQVLGQAELDLKVEYQIMDGKLEKFTYQLSEKITVEYRKNDAKLTYKASIAGWKIDVVKEIDYGETEW
jgi:hypothetical protein